MIRDRTGHILSNYKLTNAFILVMVILLVILTWGNIYIFELIKKAFFHSSIFALKNIYINGNKRVNSSDIIKASGLDVTKDGLLLLMPHIIERRIKFSSCYIDNVKLRRRLLDGLITIEIKEKEPAALISNSEDCNLYVVVDHNGLILDKVSKANEDFLPIIYSFDGAVKRYEMRKFSFLVSPSINLSLKVLRDANELKLKLLSDIHDIDAHNPDDIIVNLKSNMKIRLSRDRLREGLIDAEHWLQKFGSDVSKFGFLYMDVRFPEAIYLGNKTLGRRWWNG